MTEKTRDIWAPGKDIGPQTYVKAADFKRFWDHGWNEDFWHDDSVVEIYDDEGKWSLPLDAVVRLDRLGYACWQGDSSRKMGEMEPVWQHFRDWALGAQALTAVAVALPTSALSELKELLARHEGHFIGEEPEMPKDDERPGSDFMQFCTKENVTCDVTHLIVDVEPRYWEDAWVNGVEESNDEPKMPLKADNTWVLEIDLETGRIKDWPEGTTARTHYKICDAGTYSLVGPDGVVAKNFGYVPGMLGGGDYLKIEIGPDGVIKNWQADLSYFETSR